MVKGNQTASSLPGLTFGPLLFCAADRIQTISPVARRASTIKYNSQANDLTVCTIEVPNHGGKKEKPGSSTDPGFLAQRARLVAGLRKAGLPEGGRS